MVTSGCLTERPGGSTVETLRDIIRLTCPTETEREVDSYLRVRGNVSARSQLLIVLQEVTERLIKTALIYQDKYYNHKRETTEYTETILSKCSMLNDYETNDC